VDLVVSPTAVALNPQQGAAVPIFKAGDIIEAQVLALLGEGVATLAIGNTVIDVKTQVALTAGTTVRLAVKNTPDGIRLTLLGNAGGAASGAAGNTPATPNGAAVPNAATSPRPTVAPAATAARDGVIATPAAATVPAGSEAPVVAIGTPATPATQVDTPATQISTGTSASPPTGAMPTPVATAAVAADPQHEPVPPNPIAVAAAALSVAVQNAAAGQKGLSPLFADARIAALSPGLPEPVRQAAERLLALQPALDTSVSADGLKQALGRSGLFLEARMSAEANGGAVAPGPADDIKAALVVLRNVLKIWLAPAVPNAPMLATGSAPEDIRVAPSIVPSSTPPAAPTGAAQPPDARPPPAAPLPPPYRGAPVAGQPPVAPSISADMPPRDIGKVLLSETNGAIARQTLLQAASLPDQQAPSPHGDASGPRWLFEVPFATPQGTAVAQFEIARDGRHVRTEGVKPAWRARFSLDVEPIGPVHAQVALTGARATVTLWAERPDTSAQLRDNAPQLANALRQAELEPGELLVRFGAPPRPRDNIASGHFLDRAS
jgi:hypothetical protein